MGDDLRQALQPYLDVVANACAGSTSSAASLSAVLLASLAWAALLWLTPRYLRHRHDMRWLLFWQTMLLFALARTTMIPSIYLTLDHLLGLPNAARWMSHACALAGSYLLDTFFWTLAHGPERLTWHRRLLLYFLLLTVTAMALLLRQANLHVDMMAFVSPRPNLALVAYRLLYALFLGFMLVRLIASAARYQRQTHDLMVKVGMTLTIAGGTTGLGYAGCTLALVLISADSPLALLLERGRTLCLLISVVCVALTATAPQWGRQLRVPALVYHLQVVRAYWRLGPLWRRLSRMWPRVVLPTTISWHTAALRPHEMEFLLQRRVIEILDARRLLLAGATTPRSAAARSLDAAEPSRSARPETSLETSPETIGVFRPPDDGDERDRAFQATVMPEPDTEASVLFQRELLERLAQAEAMLLLHHLHRIRESTSEAHLIATLYQPSTFEEAIGYLELVVAALHRSGRRRGDGASNS